MLGVARKRGLELIDLGLEAGGIFIALVADGTGQFLSQMTEISGQGILGHDLMRHFSDMSCPFMHGFQQAIKAIAEGVITLWAAHATYLFKLSRSEPTGRAGRVRIEDRWTLAEKRLSEAEAHFIGDAFCL